MKECPSCKKNIADKIVICPYCSHDFEATGPASEPETKKTMMGIPSAQIMSELQALRQAAKPADDNVNRTMFGLPAVNMAELAADASDADDDDEDFGPTQVIAADDVPALGSPQPSSMPNPRATMPGGFPSIASLHRQAAEQAQASSAPSPREDMRKTMTLGSLSSMGFNQPSQPSPPISKPHDDDEDDDFGATMVVAGPQSISSLSFHDDDEAPHGDVSGFSRMGASPDYSDDKKQATLTGLHIGALAAGLTGYNKSDDDSNPPMRQTMFSLPNTSESSRQDLFGLSEVSDDEAEDVEAGSTQTLNPSQVGSLLHDVRQGQQDDNRRRLLEKLKNSKPEPAEQEPTRSTMFGIPGLGRQPEVGAAPSVPVVPEDDLFDVKSPQPSGIVRVGRRRVTSELEGIDPLGATSVLGSSSYSMVAQAVEAEEAKKPAPTLTSSSAASDISQDDLFGSTAIVNIEEHKHLFGMESLDVQSAQTTVASAELLSGLSEPQDREERDVFTDATAVASLHELGLTREDDQTRVVQAPPSNPFGAPSNHPFGASFEAAAASPSFDDVLGSMNSEPAIQRPSSPQLSERVPSRDFMPTPAVNPAIHGAFQAERQDPLSTSGPQHPMTTPPRPLVTPQPQPMPQQPEPRPFQTPLPPHEPSAPQLVPSTLDPTGQHMQPANTQPQLPVTAERSGQQQLPAQRPAAQETGGLIKGIQLGFAGLGALVLLGSTVVSVLNPLAGVALIGAIAPAVVGVLSAGSALLPASKRKIAFLLCGLLGLGAFGAGLATTGFALTTGAILALAGALFVLAAAVFSFLG